MAVRTTAMVKGLDNARKSMANFVRSATSVSGVGSAVKYVGNAFAKTFRFAEQLAAKLAIVGTVGAAGIYKVAKAASSLGEQTDNLRVTFGKEVGENVAKNAKVMGEAFGVSRAAYMESVAKIGGQLSGSFGQGQGAQLGELFTKRAMEMAAAKQIPVEEAFTRFASGLSGEMEAVRRWGVDLSEANLKLEAVSRGIAKQGQELTQTQKIQLRTILMDEKTRYVMGNIAQTAGSAEMATRSFMGRIENLAAQIGTTLLPIVASAMTELNVGIQAVSMAWSAWAGDVPADAVGVLGGTQEAATGIGFVQSAIGKVADAWQFVGMTFAYVQGVITGGLAKIIRFAAANADIIGLAVNPVGYFMGDLPSAKGMNAKADELDKLSKEQYKTFENKANAPAASEGVNKAFAAAQDRIKSMRAEAMKTDAKASDFKATGKTAPAKIAEDKFASATLAGSSEGTNAYLRSKYGAGAAGQKPEEATAKNTAETVALLKRLVGAGKGDLGQTQGLAIEALAGNW